VFKFHQVASMISKAAFTRCRKEVDFESGKVLLSRLGDKIHATSAWCTHFGAPLSQGILTADGRVLWYVPVSPEIPTPLNMSV